MARLVAEETNTKKFPSEVTADSELAPFPGVTPSGEEIRLGATLELQVMVLTPGVTVTVEVQSSRRNICEAVGTKPPTRLLAVDVKETYCASVETDGWELSALPAVMPLGEETI